VYFVSSKYRTISFIGRKPLVKIDFLVNIPPYGPQGISSIVTSERASGLTSLLKISLENFFFMNFDNVNDMKELLWPSNTSFFGF
jgi:hypothetical protein